MAIVTYSDPDHGFGVAYDDALLTHTDDTADPRLRAAWSVRLPIDVTKAVLFTTLDAGIDGIARGEAPSLLLATDDAAQPPGMLGRWAWEDAGAREARRFLEVTGADSLKAMGLYWRGYPVLQLTTDLRTGEESPPPVECLSLLYTPVQTFAIELVVPVRDLDEWSVRFQEVADGFFLLPAEREGRMRTGHQYAWTEHMDAGDLRDGLATR